MSVVFSSWSALVLSIAASIGGQALLKHGAGAASFRQQLLEPSSLAGLVAYALAALLYMAALRSLPISVALPFTAVSYVAAAVIGRLFFAEHLNGLQLAALGLICVGVAALAVGSR